MFGTIKVLWKYDKMVHTELVFSLMFSLEGKKKSKTAIIAAKVWNVDKINWGAVSPDTCCVRVLWFAGGTGSTLALSLLRVDSVIVSLTLLLLRMVRIPFFRRKRCVRIGVDLGDICSLLTALLIKLSLVANIMMQISCRDVTKFCGTIE